jgi:hypothetical protein
MSQKEFYHFYNIWKDDTKYLSYHDTKHVAYQAIIAMGKPIVPLLLANLWDSWLPILALHDIMGPIPLSPELAGRFDAISEEWYKWGEYNGYI